MRCCVQKSSGARLTTKGQIHCHAPMWSLTHAELSQTQTHLPPHITDLKAPRDKAGGTLPALKPPGSTKAAKAIAIANATAQ